MFFIINMPKSKQKVLLNKRKRGYIRKSIELAKLCNQKVMVNIYDGSSETLVTYQTRDKMGLEAFQKLRKDCKINKEVYCDEDYQLLGEKYLTSKMKAQTRDRVSSDNEIYILENISDAESLTD